MNKKTKFATALLATALLSNGFTLDTKEEATTPEPEHTTELVEEQESKPTSTPLNMVAEDEIEVEVFEENLKQPEEETPPPHPTESEPLPSTSPQQATTLTQKQADTAEPVATVIQPEMEKSDSTYFINIPEAGTMNGIDYGTSQTIQPDVTKPTYTQEQLTDPSKKPDGTPVDSPTVTQTYEQTTAPTTSQADDVYWQIQNGTYEFNGDEVIYTENSVIHITYPPENQEPVYVDGFGWVEPSNESSIRIQALDMMENGNKVGTMGGG